MGRRILRDKVMVGGKRRVGLFPHQEGRMFGSVGAYFSLSPTTILCIFLEYRSLQAPAYMRRDSIHFSVENGVGKRTC